MLVLERRVRVVYERNTVCRRSRSRRSGLLTMKAVRVIRNADIIAFPSAGNGSGVARHIAEQAIPEMSQKEMLPLIFPIVKADLSEE